MGNGEREGQELLRILQQFGRWRTDDDLDETNLNGHRERLELVAALAGFWPGGTGGLHPFGPSGHRPLSEWVSVRSGPAAEMFEVTVEGVLGVTPAGRLLATEEHLSLEFDLAGDGHLRGSGGTCWILASMAADGSPELLRLRDLSDADRPDGVLCARLVFREERLEVDPGWAPPVLAAGAWEPYRRLSEVARQALQQLSPEDRVSIEPMVAVLSGADEGDTGEGSSAVLWRTTPEIMLGAQRSVLRAWPTKKKPLRLRSLMCEPGALVASLRADWDDVLRGTSASKDGDCVSVWQRCMPDEFAVEALPIDLRSVQVRPMGNRNSSISLVTLAADDLPGRPSDWEFAFTWWEEQPNEQSFRLSGIASSGTHWWVAEGVTLSTWPVKMSLTREGTHVDRDLLLEKVRDGTIAFWQRLEAK